MKILYWYHENYENTIAGKMLKKVYIYQEFQKRCSVEHRLVCGFHNKNKIFYIIRPCNRHQGLMSIHNYVLWKIRYALKRGYIPVVDLKNYGNMYLDPKLGGKVNSWEYYFEQPTKYKLEDALHSWNVIVCDINADFGYGGIENTKEILLFNDMIQKYCRLNSTMLKKVKEITKLLLPKGKNIIGVVGRGTDYASLQPYAHAIVPGVELLTQTSHTVLMC